MRLSLILLFAAMVLSVLPLQAAPVSPYAGEQAKALKALSAQEIEQLRAGAGMGLAKPAELNHYPGPRHVLDLHGELRLTPQQLEATQRLFDDMRLRAIDIGSQIIEQEHQLEALFASQSGNEAELQRLTGRIAELNGKLRYLHLSTHLAQRRILSPEQVTLYDRLRGYGEIDAVPADHQHHHQH